MKIDCTPFVDSLVEYHQYVNLKYEDISNTNTIYTEWKTANMQIGCIPNSDSTEKLNH